MTSNVPTSDFTFKSLPTLSYSIKGGNTELRLVVVRYYLDRAGHGVQDSAARLWFNVPAQCRPNDVRMFLSEQGIAIDGLIVEIYLEKFGSFMLLEACEAAEIEWNFEMTNCADPGCLLVRLTDTSSAAGDKQLASSAPVRIPTGHVGLLAFSLMLGLESCQEFMKLKSGSIGGSYLLTWFPYGFFIGGLLQLIVGIFETLRNNVFGSAAFIVFGCVWLANGTTGILNLHFTSPDSLAAKYMTEEDKWGGFALTLYFFMFSSALLVQTFVNDKITSLVVFLLVAKYFFQLFAPWYKSMFWIKVILQCVNAGLAFLTFFFEFTNQVYHRRVFNTFKWNEENSPIETFAAPGGPQTLFSKASILRQAKYTDGAVLRNVQPGSKESPAVTIVFEKQD